MAEMAEMEEQCDGEQRTVGDCESGDAMAGRRHCGDSEVMEESNIVDDCGWKLKVGMPFDSEQAAYDFYNKYGGKLGFSIRKAYANKNKHMKEITSRTFVCYKEGSRGIDKRDPLVKNPRQEVRCGCSARFSIKLDRISGKYLACDFVEHHNQLVREEGGSKAGWKKLLQKRKGCNLYRVALNVLPNVNLSLISAWLLILFSRVVLFTLPKVNHNLISSWVVIPFSRVVLFTLPKVNHSLISSWVVILIRIMVLVSIFLNHNLVLSWVLIIIRIIVMIPTFLHLNLDLKFLWVVQVVLLLRMVHMMEITRLSHCLLCIPLTDLFRGCFEVQVLKTLQSISHKRHIVLLTVM